LDKGHQAANRVREQATSYALTLRSRMETLQDDMLSFAEGTEHFSRELRGILHIQNSEAMDELMEAEQIPNNLIDSIHGISFSTPAISHSDSESESELLRRDGPALVPIAAASKDGKGRAGKGASLTAPQPEVAAPVPKVEEVIDYNYHDKKSVSSRPLSVLQISEIKPGLHPLGGTSTRVTGEGFHEGVQVKIGRVVIDGIYVQDDGPRQVILFKSPPMNVEGPQELLLRNPDGATTKTIIQYFDDESI
jgi:hypothetical protein